MWDHGWNLNQNTQKWNSKDKVNKNSNVFHCIQPWRFDYNQNFNGRFDPYLVFLQMLIHIKNMGMWWPTIYTLAFLSSKSSYSSRPRPKFTTTQSANLQCLNMIPLHIVCIWHIFFFFFLLEHRRSRIILIFNKIIVVDLKLVS